MSTKQSKKEPTTKRKWLWPLLTFCAISPLLLITGLLLFQPEDELPSVEVLDNPPELLASVIYADDAVTELGRYWKVNRSRAEYNEISPFVIDALIATEDERYLEHSGVDFRAIMRAIVNMGSAGGASTISQQLAKLLFTLQQREREQEARAKGETIETSSSSIGRLFDRINEKARENIIATRLERRYTKEDIITMYLNQFDFLYNAVGIKNAARVYYNKTPQELAMEEAAMLVGMCKNPSYYNPYSFQVRNYRQRIADDQHIPLEEVKAEEVQALRTADSLRAANRRNQVLYQWLRNSKKGNDALRIKITEEEYQELVKKPIATNYQVVDHKQGIAPYYREALREELTNLFQEKNENGSLKYAKDNGEAWNIYRDGLRVYTTINANMQKHAEQAVTKHMKTTLQKEFDKNNRNLRNFPFSNKLSDSQVDNIMRSARRRSDRYKNAIKQGRTNSDLAKEFKTPVTMKLFSWEGEIDTVLSPDDSIRYYKSFLQAGLLSVEPATGFIKAWVGGTDMDYFAYDHVRRGKRQVGSTIKPFVYATAINMGVVKPCTPIPAGSSCIDVEDGFGNVTSRWCPKGDSPPGKNVAWALANSDNPGTVYVMSRMGGYAGPKTVSKFLESLDIDLRDADEVPSMCLGPMDLSLFQMVPAQAMFVNKGIFNAPTSILRIEDRNGNVIYSAQPKTREALNENVAYRVLKMMQGTMNFGTGASIRGTYWPWGGLTMPMAGKTGTTQNNADGWFMGLTPELATGVWVGAEDRGVRFKSILWGQGARMALPIYGYYMQSLYKDSKVKLSKADFEVPTNYDPSIFSCVDEGGSSSPDREPNFLD